MTTTVTRPAKKRNMVAPLLIVLLLVATAAGVVALRTTPPAATSAPPSPSPSPSVSPAASPSVSPAAPAARPTDLAIAPAVPQVLSAKSVMRIGGCNANEGANFRSEPQQGKQFVITVIPCQALVEVEAQQVTTEGLTYRRVNYRGVGGWVVSSLLIAA